MRVPPTTTQGGTLTTMDTTRDRDRDRPRRTALQTASALFGLAFLAVGIAGFIPGITTNFDELGFAGHQSDAEILDQFQVSVLHNIVHLLFGVLGLLAARSFDAARTFLIGGGALYLLLGIYDSVVSQESSANFLPTNNADAWLHLGLGAGMLALGLLLGRRREHERDVDVSRGQRRDEPVGARAQ
jgi:hypothetical protein